MSNCMGRADGDLEKSSASAPRAPRPRPHSVVMRPRVRLYFGEYQGNKIGVLDTKTEKFTEWPLPTPWTGPYYVTWDKNGELWTGGMTTDRAERLSPKTGQAVGFLLQHVPNTRRVLVVN